MVSENMKAQAIGAGSSSKAGKKGFKAIDTGYDSNFNSMLDAASAMSTTAATAGQMYGNVPASVALGAAFSGMSQTSAATGGMGGGSPFYSAGYGGSYGGTGSQLSGMQSLYGGKAASLGVGGLPGDSSGVAGTDGMSQMDLINTMNQNNLQLLELQAVMQNNMQSWNTKSNILSADHRARMSMIEKFTARG